MSVRPLLMSLLGLLALHAWPVFADERSGAKPDRAWQVVLERLDLNKNGSIEVEELSARLQQAAQQTDTNHDGTISLEELRQAARQARQVAGERLRTAARQLESRKVPIAALEQRVHQALARVDADHNGELTGAEIHRAVHVAAKATRERLAADCAQHRAAVESVIREQRSERRQTWQAIAKRIETIRPEEVAVAVAINQLDSNGDRLLQSEELQAQGERILNLVDANRDGALSEEEITQAAETAAKRVRERIEQRLASLLKPFADR